MTKFNRNRVRFGSAIEDPDGTEIKATPSLWNASVDDACRFGGDLTRVALGALTLDHDRRYVTVDSKVHLLMPGMLPAIPGWHTDGVPREPGGSPSIGSRPLLDVQEAYDEEGRAAHYHLIVTGTHCSPEFYDEPVDLDVPSSSALYTEMTREIERLRVQDPDMGMAIFEAPRSRWVHWDWWNIHRAIPAKANGWRLLIRVTESDFLPPQTDIRQVIRLHNPVYIPEVYGW